MTDLNSYHNNTIAQTRVGDRAGWPAAKHVVRKKLKIRDSSPTPEHVT